MQWCLFCGKPNQPSSTFCIHCGRSLDEDSVREYARGLDYDPPQDYREIASRIIYPDGRFSLRKLLASGRLLEFVAGVVLLLGITGFAIYATIQQSTHSEHYKRAQAAEERIDYDLALAEYNAAGDYRDATLRSTKLRERIAERDKAYTIAEQSRKERKWWLTANSLRKVEESQPNYKDTRTQLANARRVNGTIFYKLPAPGDGGQGRGGIYVSYADGGDPVLLPHTDEHSTVLAVSADSRWATYAIGNGFAQNQTRSVHLYDVATRLDYKLGTSFEAFTNTPVARFTADSQKVCVDVSGSGTCYALPFLGEYAEVPRPLAPRAVEELRPVEHKLVVESVRLFADAFLGGGSEVYVVSKGLHLLETKRHVNTEMGRVDGAVFSSNGDFLLYRACAVLNLSRDYACSLRLVDLTLNGLYPYTIARLPTRSLSPEVSELTGGFTRDGRHVLIVQKHMGTTEVRLYTLNSGDSWTLGAGDTEKLTAALAEKLLVPIGSPGLSAWAGQNALTYTGDSPMLPEPEAGWLPRYFGRGQWVAASPNDRYLLYLDGEGVSMADAEAIGTKLPVTYTLNAAPFRSTLPSKDGATTVRLFGSTTPPGRWLSNIYMLPEGQTLLSTEPPTPGDAPGLYAYDLQTGQATLAIPAVLDLWRPGFYTLQPEIPTYEPAGKQASGSLKP